MWISVIMSSCCGGPAEYLAPLHLATNCNIFRYFSFDKEPHLFTENHAWH